METDDDDALIEIFADPEAFDYHLLDNTLTRDVIIDQGGIFSSMISLEMDLDGVERQGAPDVGAYEWVD